MKKRLFFKNVVPFWFTPVVLNASKLTTENDSLTVTDEFHKSNPFILSGEIRIDGKDRKSFK